MTLKQFVHTYAEMSKAVIRINSHRLPIGSFRFSKLVQLSREHTAKTMRSGAARIFRRELSRAIERATNISIDKSKSDLSNERILKCRIGAIERLLHRWLNQLFRRRQFFRS